MNAPFSGFWRLWLREMKKYVNRAGGRNEGGDGAVEPVGADGTAVGRWKEAQSACCWPVLVSQPKVNPRASPCLLRVRKLTEQSPSGAASVRLRGRARGGGPASGPETASKQLWSLGERPQPPLASRISLSSQGAQQGHPAAQSIEPPPGHGVVLLVLEGGPGSS